MPVEKPKGKGKSKKRAADDSLTTEAIAQSTNLALKDYLVEYSKSSRATCKHCDIKICKVSEINEYHVLMDVVDLWGGFREIETLHSTIPITKKGK